MPFGIPSEDFHGGFGLPHDEDDYDPTPASTPLPSKQRRSWFWRENWVSESPEMSDEDREIAEAAQEAHDELVRSLIEAGGEIRELKEMLHDVKNALLYMLVLHDSTHGHNMQEAVQILYHLQSDNRWNVQKAKEALKKVSDYLEQEDT